MTNFIEKGYVIEYTVPSGGVTSGAAVLIGSMVGIAASTGEEDDVIAVNLQGVYEVPKASGAVTKGARLYYDESEEDFTTTAAGNVFAGFAWAAQESGDTTVLILLDRADDSGSTLSQAAFVADITSSNLVGVDGTGSNAAPLAGTETRLDALESKVNAILDSLQTAGLMAAS